MASEWKLYLGVAALLAGGVIVFLTNSSFFGAPATDGGGFQFNLPEWLFPRR